MKENKYQIFSISALIHSETILQKGEEMTSMNIDKLKLQTDIYNELISLGWTETDYNGFSDQHEY